MIFVGKIFLQQAFPLKNFSAQYLARQYYTFVASVLKFLSSAMKKFPCSIYVLHLSTKTQYKPAYSQLFQYFPSCLQHLPCCPKCRSVAFWRQLLRLQQDLDRFLKKRERKIVNWKYRRFWKRTFTFSSFVQVERLSTYLLSINLQKETKCDNSPTLRTN